VSAALRDVVKTVVPYKVYAPVRGWIRSVNALRYKGDEFTCPLCDGRFARFFPTGYDFPVLREKQVVGAGLRENAVCPRCYAEDRERLVFLFLQHKRAEIFSTPTKLLHVAPERSLSVKLRSSPTIDYVSADLDSASADVRMDITAIEEKDETYDAVVCNHVLEHIPDDRKAMAELHRVVKKGGFAILQVPISFTAAETYEDVSIKDPAARETHFGQCDHVRIYGRDYIDRLESVGFQVSTHRAADFLEVEKVREYALNPEERIFFCARA
jgi:SAM-dependent methyltransferase